MSCLTNLEIGNILKPLNLVRLVIVFIFLVVVAVFIYQKPIYFGKNVREIKLPDHLFYYTNYSHVNQSYRQMTCEEINRTVNKKGYSTSNCKGRLGNQLGVVAIGLQIHLRFGVSLMLNNLQYKNLNNVFDMEQICQNVGTSFCFRLPEGCNLVTEGMETIKAPEVGEFLKKGLSLYGQLPSDVEGKKLQLHLYPHFLPWIIKIFLAEFRDRMKFHHRVVSGADLIVKKARDEYNCSEPSSCVLVVVHMRMEDVLRFIQRKDELLDRTNYLPNAFDYVQTHHPNPLFLVVGHTCREISNYFKKRSKQFDNHTIVQAWQLEEKAGLSKDIGAGVDFAILGLADVVILTYGTYGTFGALFGRDKLAIYYPANHSAHGITRGLPRFKGLNWKT